MLFAKDLKQFLCLSPVRKLGVLLVLFFTFLLGLGAFSFYLRQTSKVKPPASSQNLPKKATFSLLPQTRTINKGETFIIGVNFDSGDYKVEAADCILGYDPKALQVTKVSSGLFFAQYLEKEAKDGKILITGTIGMTGQQKGGVKGKGPFGSIELKALGIGTTNLSFVKGETIVASGGKNVLGETQGGVYTIK